MKRDNELRERRNKAIFVRFNELIMGDMTHEAIYSQLEDEFYLSCITIKQIVLRITRTHGEQILYFFLTLGEHHPLICKKSSNFAAGI